jgi:hypothetical protein
LSYENNRSISTLFRLDLTSVFNQIIESEEKSKKNRFDLTL